MKEFKTIKELNLKNMYTHEFEKIVEAEMTQPLKHLERELATIRTGRAHTSMIEDIKVTCYGGSQLSLREVASLSTPDARLLMVEPWDKGIINDIEKGILASSLGVTPVNDGNVIRIQLPEVSSQRREELIKVLGKKLEDCKEGVRYVRGQFRTLVKDAERDHQIEEDFSKKLQDLLQKIHDKYIALAEQYNEKKEKEIRAV